MRPGNFFITIIFNAFFVVVLAMQASCAAPQSIATQTGSPPGARDALTEQITSQADASELVSAAREPDIYQGRLMQDGLTLLKSRCTMCHAPEWFGQFEKSPAEWETVLERMKSLGVQLSDTEKDILLDYLVAADKP